LSTYYRTSRTLIRLDSLLSILQISFGTPVAVVIDIARNVALAALRILVVKYPGVAEDLKKFVEGMKEEVLLIKLGKDIELYFSLVLHFM